MDTGTPLARVLGCLPTARPSPQGEDGHGRWKAQCPTHEDDTPSLQVTETPDGTVLLKCFAGCSSEKVLQALELSMRDLFPRVKSELHPAFHRPQTFPQRRIAQTYDYHDAEGGELFQVVRFEPKSFAQRRPDRKGGWTWGLGGTEPVLYRLPAVLEAAQAGRTVFVVEGEKDADALAALGLTEPPRLYRRLGYVSAATRA